MRYVAMSVAYTVTRARSAGVPCGGGQGGEEIGEGSLELLGEGVADDLAVGVESGLARQEHHARPGGDDRVGEASGRGEFGRVDALGAHRASWFAYNSLAMMPRWTSLAPS